MLLSSNRWSGQWARYGARGQQGDWRSDARIQRASRWKLRSKTIGSDRITCPSSTCTAPNPAALIFAHLIPHPMGSAKLPSHLGKVRLGTSLSKLGSLVIHRGISETAWLRRGVAKTTKPRSDAGPPFHAC
ncbi:hypothetical protein L1887_61417 [Cichorium endivia]|nr:hypothetical protein L1887_61417 [Cichorium endivia]